jgi:2-polyprenyl-3-methyl-5-hydroxy-6-metoxy-1,4-benzoquinol methylase
MLNLDFSLTQEESVEMTRMPENAWFTQVKFANAVSPRCQEGAVLDVNHEMKKNLVLPWIRESVRGQRVLDLFSANGAFAVECALAGCKEVVAIEFNEERVRCAQFLARVLERNGVTAPRFCVGDVYTIADRFAQPFDVVLCMGGLYHIADPPYILTQLRKLLVKGKLIVQTSGILPGGTNKATFVIREDQTSKGLTSLRGGKGVWKVSVPCFRAILMHAGFRVLTEKRPAVWQRRRFPWYCALAEPF